MNGLARRWSVGALLAAGLAGQAAAAGAQEPPAALEVEDCRSCHESSVKAVEATRHFGVPERCEACHQGVREHLKSLLASGEPGPIVKSSTLPAQAVDRTCQTCHAKSRPAHFQGSPHDRRGLSCSSCHSVHGFRSEKALFRTQTESETCFRCHPGVRAKMNRVSHHPLREGVLQCSACHDVHGSNPKLVAADWVNETCYQCHAEKRGPFLWEHAPARDNCMNCHEPHGSNHRPLLVNKPPYLCQRCHLNTLHAAVLYDGRDTPRGAAPTAFGTGRACTNCHRSIHGTNAPSGTILVR